MTTYAQVTDGRITKVGSLPKSARRLDSGDWVLGLRDAPMPVVEATGWFPVTKTQRPENDKTKIHTASIELIAGTPTEVWIGRLKTGSEQSAEALDIERSKRRDDLRASVETLRQWADDAGDMAINNANASDSLQVVVNRLAVVFDRFADLIDQTQ